MIFDNKLTISQRIWLIWKLDFVKTSMQTIRLRKLIQIDRILIHQIVRNWVLFMQLLVLFTNLFMSDNLKCQPIHHDILGYHYIHSGAHFLPCNLISSDSFYQISKTELRKKSFKISKIRFLMVHQKLIFIFLVSFGHGDETGHWCKGESQRNYEVIVSPRLVDSVPCLELYRSGKIYLIDIIYSYLRR